ncbi:MAG: cyclic dehypoxanthinyl futalosine synthase [Gemmatimonadota bacterium]|nr:cyclic dehypoxanthinyl futalosine synthase [Gemmatimonadota bacterium]
MDASADVREIERPMLENVRRTLAAGERLTPAEGEWLLTRAPLVELGSLAAGERFRRHPEPEVTYVLDSNPNYTNVCTIDCVFCAFYRHAGDDDAYTHSVEEVMEKVAWAVEQGATTVLLQGGVNPELPLEYYLDVVRETVRRFPEVTPHYWSAVEIQGMAEVSGRSVKEVLEALWDAGQRTIPGGGAEILAPRVRRKLGKRKGGPEAWMEVHEAAHLIGFRTTATMMYGSIETPAEVIEHLDRVRALQDRSLAEAPGSFTAFIPWSFKPGNTPLEKVRAEPEGPAAYLRAIAVSRLYLDNVDHVQASWFSEGKKTGQIALHWGADDFGGTLFEESVHAEAKFVNTTTVEEIRQLIREAGFTPVQRDTLYERLPETPLEELATRAPRRAGELDPHALPVVE